MKKKIVGSLVGQKEREGDGNGGDERERDD